MSYEIQRLGLVGVLDQAIALTSDNFRLLISIMLLLLVTFSLIVGFITLAITPALPPHPLTDDFAVWRTAKARHSPFFALVEINRVPCIYPIPNAAAIQALALTLRSVAPRASHEANTKAPSLPQYAIRASIG
jgi:hypothetical protein